MNSAPWCHSPSSWKVAVVRITDSPDAEAGPQRGAFRDAHGHPSLVSPHEAVLRSHLSISSFRSLWFRTLGRVLPCSIKVLLPRPPEVLGWVGPELVPAKIQPSWCTCHVVLQRLRGDCHCRVPEDRVRGSETAAKPPAGGVAAWLPSFSPPQGRSWPVPSHYVHVEQTLQELNATHSASGSNRTVTLAYGNYQN